MRFWADPLPQYRWPSCSNVHVQSGHGKNDFSASPSREGRKERVKESKSQRVINPGRNGQKSRLARCCCLGRHRNLQSSSSGTKRKIRTERNSTSCRSNRDCGSSHCSSSGSHRTRPRSRSRFFLLIRSFSCVRLQPLLRQAPRSVWSSPRP